MSRTHYALCTRMTYLTSDWIDRHECESSSYTVST